EGGGGVWLVMPALQWRGVSRTAYAGTTRRDPRGLARPQGGAWRHCSGAGGGRHPTATGGGPGGRTGAPHRDEQQRRRRGGGRARRRGERERQRLAPSSK